MNLLSKVASAAWPSTKIMIVHNPELRRLKINKFMAFIAEQVKSILWMNHASYSSGENLHQLVTVVEIEQHISGFC